jgi:hypothetical protein
MNTKQIACIMLLVAIAVAVQIGLTLRKGAQAAAEEVQKAQQEEETLTTQSIEGTKLSEDLRIQSQGLIEFSQQWDPYFAIIEDQQSAETAISMRVRESGLLNMAQRYQQVPNKVGEKNSASLPKLVRATLVFDDKYAPLLNWLGAMEQMRPTARVNKLTLTKGTRGEDLRMELILEVPLRTKTTKP